MKTLSALLAFVLALTVSSLRAQQPVRPAVQIPPPSSQSVGDHLVKEVDIKGVSLHDAIQSLESECPGFQTVIIHDPRYPDFNPVLPDMSLKNLPLSQILEVIGKSVPELRVDKVSSGKGDVWIFRIHRTNDAGQPTVAGRPNLAGQPTVMVYRLSPLIRSNVTDRSKALNDILSLVQAALEATASNEPPPLMKVHTATETLVFRGYPTQLEAVKCALEALQSTPDEIRRSKQLEQAENDQARLMLERERLEASLAQARSEAAEARKRMNQQTEDIERLQARLRSLEKSH
ncbi:MAG: hypothetical protein ABSG53_20720 [Thermoguttaceae bacterium]